MGQDAVQKGYHCAYQLHYHIVFPVKYRKALLSEAITQAIKEIALGIQERYAIEIERIGCDRDHIHLFMQCSSQVRTWPIGASVQEHHGARCCSTGFPHWRKNFGVESSGRMATTLPVLEKGGTGKWWSGTSGDKE